MARNRLNPWPSVADLFSALSVVAFAALIIVAANAVIVTETERNEREGAADLARNLEQAYKQAVDIQVNAGTCRDRATEQCIDIPFRFATDRSDLLPAGVQQVRDSCRIYREAVEKVVAAMQAKRHRFDRSQISLLIEGHTDKRVPPDGSDRDKFLHNWRLSSERAASVLYEFRQCGVSPENGYHISSVGLAATRPLCEQANPDGRCHEQNRRTTMRIRVELSDPNLTRGE